MAKQTFTVGQVLTAAQMTSLQQTAMGGGSTTAKTASYTLVAADAGTVVQMNSASATTITVNTALFAAGDTVQIQNVGVGVCTVTAGSATVSTSSTLALKQFDAGSLYFNTTSAAIFFASDAADGSSPLTTKGDLYGFSTLDARIPIGTNNQVLTADSAQALGLKWATPAAAASGLTKIVSGSFTGVAAVAINGCFTSTYKKYLLVVGGISDSTDPGEIYLQLQYSTSTVHSANYFSCSDSRNENGTLTTLTASNTTKWILGKARLADDRHQFTATFTNVGNSAQNGAFSCYGNLGNQGYNIAGGMVNSNQTWTGIYLSGQGNIDGEYTVYGLEN